LVAGLDYSPFDGLRVTSGSRPLVDRRAMSRSYELVEGRAIAHSDLRNARTRNPDVVLSLPKNDRD